MLDAVPNQVHVHDMGNDLFTPLSGELTQYDPDRGLAEVVVSEAAEKHWRRAKNADKLFEAVKAKLTAQAEYVCWRDGAVTLGRPKKKAPSSRNILPESDPGFRVIERWRKRLCS